MDWFVNYWHRPYRDTSFNVAIARTFVCLLAAWKVAAYPFGGVAFYPTHLVDADDAGLWRLWPEYGMWIGVEQCIGVICLIACAVGIAPGLTALAAAGIISHLTAVAWPVTMEKTWLPIVYFLLLYAIFRHEDRYVLWPARRVGSAVAPAGSAVAAAAEGSHMRALKWFLMTIALIYFFAGLHKLEGGGWTATWASPVNMSRMLEERALGRGNQLPAFVAWLQRWPILLGAMGVTTIVLELGLFFAVLTNRFLTTCLLGLAAMHLGIWATMSVNYFTDLGAMYLVFLPWDTLLGTIAYPRIARRSDEFGRYSRSG